MAFSKLDICNMALAQVPARPIASFDEHSTEAQECRRAYQPAKSALLASNVRGWQFAIEIVAPPPTANKLAHMWLHAFGLDADKELVDVSDSRPPDYHPMVGLAVSDVPYQVMGDVLHTNIPTPLVSYRSMDVTEDRFSHAFADALAFEVAQRLVMPITKDRMRHRDLLLLAGERRAHAVADDWNRRGLNTYGNFVPALFATRA